MVNDDVDNYKDDNDDDGDYLKDKSTPMTLKCTENLYVIGSQITVGFL